MARTFIIAEAGVNHNGNLKLAKKMIVAAARAGADAIKFQTFKTELLVTPNAPKAFYQKKNTKNQESQFDMIKKLELDVRAHRILMAHCRKNRISFLSSPFDLASIDLLQQLGLGLFKIPSGEITNLPFLRKIGSSRKKIILSTGMSTLQEVKDAVQVLKKSGIRLEDITLLHCNTEYPTPFKDVNLRAMLTLKNKLGVSVGYSDHTIGSEVSIAAVALGATVIEKHFTLDRTMLGPDHKASLEPSELASMIRAIRNVEMALGDGVKKPSKSESKNMTVVRKSIVAACHIKQSELFTEKNITIKRPGTGLSPMKWDLVLGRRAKRDYKIHEAIEL